jgi:hypothetical protein
MMGYAYIKVSLRNSAQAVIDGTDDNEDVVQGSYINNMTFFLECFSPSGQAGQAEQGGQALPLNFFLFMNFEKCNFIFSPFLKTVKS